MPSVTAVALALSSLTLMAAGEPAVRTGASLTALTVMARFSVSVSTPPLAVPPLSCTVQVRLPLPLALATVLYFRPCSSVSVTVVLAVTCVDAIGLPERDVRGNGGDFVGQRLARLVAAAAATVGQSAHAQRDGGRVGAVFIDVDGCRRTGRPYRCVVDGVDGDG